MRLNTDNNKGHSSTCLGSTTTKHRETCCRTTDNWTSSRCAISRCATWRTSKRKEEGKDPLERTFCAVPLRQTQRTHQRRDERPFAGWEERRELLSARIVQAIMFHPDKSKLTAELEKKAATIDILHSVSSRSRCFIRLGMSKAASSRTQCPHRMYEILNERNYILWLQCVSCSFRTCTTTEQRMIWCFYDTFLHHQKAGKFGRVSSPCSNTRCKWDLHAGKLWENHILGRRWNSKLVWKRSGFLKISSQLRITLHEAKITATFYEWQWDQI